jgi:hypothetical protein
MPSVAMGPGQLDGQHIPVALPGFVEREPAFRRRIAVKHNLMQHRLLAHGVRHAGQELKEWLALARADLEDDGVGDRHGGRSRRLMGRGGGEAIPLLDA